MTSIGDLFAPVLGLPSWLVRRGHGSFLTFEFGAPTLTVEEPRPRTLRLRRQDARRFLTRTTTIHGEWHLWVYCCVWTLRGDGTELAHSESHPIDIARALGVLDGQALTQVEVDTAAVSTFTFDLGCVLTTVPAPAGSYGHEPVEQWYLFQPDGRVLTVRSDGLYMNRPGSSHEDTWEPITDR